MVINSSTMWLIYRDLLKKECIKMKKYLILFFMAILLLTACQSNEEIAEEFSDKIESITDNRIPTSEEISSLESEYQNLNDKQKELIANYKKLERYSSYDLDSMNDIFNKINVLYESYPEESEIPYTEAKEIYDEYNKLTSTEQGVITECIDTSKLYRAVNINNHERCVISALEYLRSHLKNKSSLEIYDIEVRAVPRDSFSTYIYIEFSATNDFGGRMDDTIYLLASGYDVELSNSTDFKKGYNNLDPDISWEKILSNLDYSIKFVE